MKEHSLRRSQRRITNDASIERSDRTLKNYQKKKNDYSIDRYHSVSKLTQFYLYFDSLQFLLFHSLQMENTKQTQTQTFSL